jgi:very-short-patch-repair endonuclease
MNKRNLQFAKAMRHEPTEAESALWPRLRAGRLLEFKFKRQQPIGDFIVDFVCFQQGVVVEVDGGQHADDECSLADQGRTRWLEGKGFRVLRFWNNDILQRADDVLESIIRALRDSPSPQPLSHKGRGLKNEP